MIRFAFVLAVLASAACEKDSPSLRIIGGRYASPGQFPFQVSIEVNGRHHCGGTLIALNMVLTSAFCVEDVPVRRLSVLAGTIDRLRDGVEVGVADAIPHRRYHPVTKENDVAILKLAKTLRSSKFINVAELPEQNEAIYSNQVATVSGWGVERPEGPMTNRLRYVEVPLWSNEYCRQVVTNLPYTLLCAGDTTGQHNACEGDTGGPLSVGNKVIGIVSGGFGCGIRNAPVFYTYVAGQRDWIRRIAGV